MSKHTLPVKSVKVGLFSYALEVWDPKEANRDSHFGETHFNEALMLIDTSFGPRQTASTLLHELLHCAVWYANAKQDDNEERLVTGLSLALGMLWRDNPKVFAWIHAELTAP